MLLLRRLLVAVTVVAFVMGMTIQVTPSATLGLLGSSSHVDNGCPHMTMHPSAEQKPMPARGMDTDCVKQMGCVGTPTLPIRSGETAVPFADSLVRYSLPSTQRAGGTVKPELLPPIGL